MWVRCIFANLLASEESVFDDFAEISLEDPLTYPVKNLLFLSLPLPSMNREPLLLIASDGHFDPITLLSQAIERNITESVHRGDDNDEAMGYVDRE